MTFAFGPETIMLRDDRARRRGRSAPRNVLGEPIDIRGLASRVPERGVVADVREVTECSGLDLIFLRHPPKLVGDLSVRRYPRVTHAKSRKVY